MKETQENGRSPYMSQATEPLLITTSASGSLTSGMRTDVRIRDFGNVVMDEPEALGGTDNGPNPMEFVMGALNGCVGVMIRLIAGEMGFEFQGVQFQADGVIDVRGLFGTADVARHFQQVNFDVHVSTQEPAERLEELRQKVHDRCPALNLLKDAGVKVNARWIAVA